MKVMDYKELVQKSQKGDTESFGLLYDLFADRLFRFISFKVSDREQAEDILQEAFVKAWKGLPKLRLENLNFSAWIYKITSNTINDYFRKIYRSPQMLELNEQINIAAPGDAAQDTIKANELESMQKSLRLLPKNYRQILELRFVQDLTVQETADILGKSNLAIRVLQHRALKQLKIIINSQSSREAGWPAI